MPLTQGNQVLFANHRLPTRVDIHIDAHILALTDNAVDGFQTQIQLMAVLAQQPVQCRLQADVGSNRTAHGILQFSFFRISS